MNMMSLMKQRRYFFLFAALMIFASVSGQCRYCNTYEDFLNDRWIRLGAVSFEQHSKSRQAWWGGNDYSLTTGNVNVDKTLKKNAFIVMQADTLYVNCRNLRFEGTRFGNGYTKAIRIGNRSILFVNKLIGEEAQTNRQMTAFMFGAIGTAIAEGKNIQQQVCYVISYGADAKGHVNIRLIDDALMEQMMEGHDDLRDEYFSEQDDKKRMQATHIIPLLEKGGLFKAAASRPLSQD